MLCFLNKSSVVKNLDLSSVLPVDPVTFNMTNITFFWLKSAFITRDETRNFKLPWDIFGDYGNAETWVICFRWMLWYDAGANIKISHAGHANFMPGMPRMPNPNGFTIGIPGMPSRTSKNWEWNISPARDLGPKFSYNLGQNKMEKQIPIPPNQGWRRAKDKNAPFSHPWFGGGAGGVEGV